jgi:putative endonuclease
MSAALTSARRRDKKGASRSGEIGRRRGLKIPRPSRPCRFESGLRHQSSFGAKRRTKTAAAYPLQAEKPGYANLLVALRTSPRQAMSDFYYVYILRSIDHPNRHYTGITDDLHSRLQKHNAGGCPHTLKFRPWRIKTAIAFESKEKASAFEKYLKSHSGRAFAKKHF